MSWSETAAPESKNGPRHIALFLRAANEGGVANSFLRLASAFVRSGHRVDLVLCRVKGAYLDQVPPGVHVTGLRAVPAMLGRASALMADRQGLDELLLPVLLAPKSARTLRYLPDLTRYLRRERPDALLSAITYPNLAALWARRLAGVPTRVVISERANLSDYLSYGANKRSKWRFSKLAPVISRVYPWADAIVAVSKGVADDLSSRAAIPRQRISPIYNPVVSPELFKKALVRLEHPWFQPGAAPVILSVGRLHYQKDFPTLFRAFARVRARREVRLLVLGGGKGRTELEALVRSMGLGGDVELRGFVANPFAYMARAAVFVLSSAYEGFGNALVEALACGCPVVSTDCPSGPAEILEGGAYGRLVPVGDDAAMAEAILRTLDTEPHRERLRKRAARFSVEASAREYLRLLLPPSEPRG